MRTPSEPLEDPPTPMSGPFPLARHLPLVPRDRLLRRDLDAQSLPLEALADGGARVYLPLPEARWDLAQLAAVGAIWITCIVAPLLVSGASLALVSLAALLLPMPIAFGLVFLSRHGGVGRVTFSLALALVAALSILPFMPRIVWGSYGESWLFVLMASTLLGIGVGSVILLHLATVARRPAWVELLPEGIVLGETGWAWGRLGWIEARRRQGSTWVRRPYNAHDVVARLKTGEKLLLAQDLTPTHARWLVDVIDQHRPPAEAGDLDAALERLKR